MNISKWKYKYVKPNIQNHISTQNKKTYNNKQKDNHGILFFLFKKENK